VYRPGVALGVSLSEPGEDTSDENGGKLIHGDGFVRDCILSPHTYLISPQNQPRPTSRLAKHGYPKIALFSVYHCFFLTAAPRTLTSPTIWREHDTDDRHEETDETKKRAGKT
jgi:hypothetical protein